MGLGCSKPRVSESRSEEEQRIEEELKSMKRRTSAPHIQHYAKVQRLGEGSYAKVILVRDTQDGELYAAKVYTKERLKKKRTHEKYTAWDDVVRELSILRRIRHPHVVRLIEVLDDPKEKNLYAIMEYVSGGAVIAGCGMGLPECLCRLYLRDAVCGLQFLHACGVIHMDVKPENLMLTEDGRVKVGDLGLGKVVFDGETIDDRCSASYGTPYFAPPEACSGKGEYSGTAADTWALGVTAFVLMLGRFPFDGDTACEVYEHISEMPVHIPDGMSSHAHDFLRRTMDKNPSTRLTLPEAMDHPFLTHNNSLPPLRPVQLSKEELCALWAMDEQVQAVSSTVGVGAKLIAAMSNFPNAP
mmetsp:Transcript_8143/g.50419  ORF Transcript_8143/g.50419 Transcript_8143/m.50419 type:complete len:357 (+) Transcript_8143:78-1148(+)